MDQPIRDFDDVEDSIPGAGELDADHAFAADMLAHFRELDDLCDAFFVQGRAVTLKGIAGDMQKAIDAFEGRLRDWLTKNPMTDPSAPPDADGGPSSTT